MSEPTDIRACRYAKCEHPDKAINVTKDDYVVVGNNLYYHRDCLEAKKEDEKIKSDLRYIRDKWTQNIGFAPFDQLNQCLKDLLSHGYSSGYLVFVMDYVISHRLNLHYPQGFKYFAAKQKIRDAWEKRRLKGDIVKLSSFAAADSQDASKFTVAREPQGFGQILGGGKK